MDVTNTLSSDCEQSVDLCFCFKTHKALMWRRLGFRSTLKRKYSSSENCQLKCDSENQVSLHHQGPKYSKRSESTDSKTPEPVVNGTTLQIFSLVSSFDKAEGESLETENVPSEENQSKKQSCSGSTEQDVEEPAGESAEENALRFLYCSLCKVSVNSAAQLQAHNSGSKHKTMLEALSGDGAIKSFPRPGVKAKLAASYKPSTGLQDKTFHCETCDVHINSETQLKQHISSRRHKDRAAGKPDKPKFNHYSMAQHQQSFSQVHQTPTKRPKPSFVPCFLQHPLSVAAASAMMSLSNYPCRHSYKSNPTFFQGSSLAPTVLHASPIRLCYMHTPVFPHY